MKRITIDKSTAKRIAANIFYPLLALSFALAVWAIWSASKGMPYVLPMPGSVLKEFFTLGGSGKFWLDVLATLGRTIGCFALSFVLALIFAVLGGVCKPVHRLISPIVSILRAAPTVAVILIAYAFMTKNSMAITVGFLVAFPVLYSAFYSAIDGVDRDLIDMAKLYGVRPIDRVRFIYLPQIAPTLFDTSGATLSLTLKVIVAAEILTNISLSIGNNIQISYAAFEITPLLAWTLISIVFSFVLEVAAALFKKIWEVTR